MSPTLTAAWARVLGATPEPVLPELREGLDPDSVTPGVLGFLVIFAAVLACIPLFLSMTGKLRRVEHAARAQDVAEGAAAAPAPSAPAPSDPAPDAAPPAAPVPPAAEPVAEPPSRTD